MKQGLREEIAKELDFIGDHWVKGDDRPPFNYGGWRDECLDKIIELVNEQDIDWSIDVRYEEDVIEAFNKFIKKWCGSHYPHLIDTDEQDGQFMRDKIQALIEQGNK